MSRNTNSLILTSSESGFTLIELLIYMGLVGFLIGGTIGVVYDLVASQRGLNDKVFNDGEAQFLIAKIDSALSGVTVSLPAPNNSGAILSVNKDGTPIVIDLNGSQLEFNNIPLNNSWSVVSNLNFTRTTVGPSDSITATFELNGKSYQTTRLISR